MTFVPSISPQKSGKKLGIKNFAQLPINEKLTPGLFIGALLITRPYSSPYVLVSSILGMDKAFENEQGLDKVIEICRRLKRDRGLQLVIG
jgi:hypothetical protein